MFSKTITNSGKFLKMPATSRLLYYDLGMNADDDGYTEWFTIVRMSGSTEQDLKVLQANGFVKIFDENVLVILDWKENNYLRSDRYTPSKYKEIYKDEVKLLDTTGIPNDNQMDTQVRLGKVRKGKVTIATKVVAEEFDLKDYIQKLEYSPRRDHGIIALYWRFKKPKITNVEQARNELKRFLRAAKRLEPYEDERIYKTMQWLDKNADFKWTLESAEKYITEDLSTLKKSHV